MKTLTDQIDELLEQLIYCDFRTEAGIDKAKRVVRIALKEQDKITRHACAESILDHNERFFLSHNNTECISVDDAESLIINTKAV